MATEFIEDYATSDEVPMSFLTKSSGDGSGVNHKHGFVEIFYIISGSILHKFNEDPARSIETGDAYIILKGNSHGFYRDDNTVCAHRDILIRDSFFKEVCAYISPDLYDRFLRRDIPCTVKLSSDRINYFEQEINIINQILPISIKEKTAMMRTLAVALLEPFLLFNTAKNFENYPPWFKDLLANFNKVRFLKLGLNAITQNINYDKKYLCRVFKKYMGMTMTDYLNHVRLDYAINMIQNTDRNILDIAQDLGFSSISYFNVIFKKRYGITPMQARHRKII